VVLYGRTRASTCFFPTLFIAAVVRDHNNDGQKDRNSTVIDGGPKDTSSSLFYKDKCVHGLNYK